MQRHGCRRSAGVGVGQGARPTAGAALPALTAAPRPPRAQLPRRAPASFASYASPLAARRPGGASSAGSSSGPRRGAAVGRLAASVQNPYSSLDTLRSLEEEGADAAAPPALPPSAAATLAPVAGAAGAAAAFSAIASEVFAPAAVDGAASSGQLLQLDAAVHATVLENVPAAFRYTTADDWLSNGPIELGLAGCTLCALFLAARRARHRPRCRDPVPPGRTSCRCAAPSYAPRCRSARAGEPCCAPLMWSAL
jgi:hypothetical protein